MRKLTIADLFGMPAQWANYLHGDRPVEWGLSGAVISEVALSDNGVAFATEGAPCGPTYGAFVIENVKLRRRVYAALRVGDTIEKAANELI